jgi:hypothetical protein
MTSRWAREVGGEVGGEASRCSEGPDVDPWDFRLIFAPILETSTHDFWKAAVEEVRSSGMEPVEQASTTFSAGHPDTLLFRWTFDRWLRVLVVDNQHEDSPWCTIFSSENPNLAGVKSVAAARTTIREYVRGLQKAVPTSRYVRDLAV